MPDPSYWIDADWPAPAHIRAGSTTRVGGCSRRPYESFNLGAHVGDDAQAVAHNRATLLHSLKLPGEPLWLQQVHGSRVYDWASPADVRADAAWTDRPGTVCAVLTADCVPLLLCNSAGTEVAAVHVGWRGLSRGVIAQALARFREQDGGLLAWIGPHIGPDHYQVGDEVRQACVPTGAGAAAGFSRSEGGRWMADLGFLVRAALKEHGVTACFASPHCSFSRADLFYSYRRDGTTGRMAGLIWMEGRQGEV